MSFSLSHRKPMEVGQIGIAQEDLPPYEQGRIDLRAWFAPARGSEAPHVHAGLPRPQLAPLELEIGSGKGTFLLQQARLTPHVNYLGIEWARQFWMYAADRCRRHGLTNVRLLRTEAAFFVKYYVPDGVFRQVHIYFPDPWPKKRHHKRRLIQVQFLRELWRVLQTPEAEGGGEKREEGREKSEEAGATVGAGAGETASAAGDAMANVSAAALGSPVGLVRLCTDHTEYFQWMMEQAALVADLFEPLPFESPLSAGEGELVGTNFERKYRREGRPFHGMILRKRAPT